MPEHYQHLGVFSDWVAAARRQQVLYPTATAGAQTQQLLREVLGFCHEDENPIDARVENEWEEDGLVGEQVSWSVGFGPRTQAYVLKPAGTKKLLPGIVALHDHSDFKFYGKEKIADGPGGPLPGMRDFRKIPYAGRAYANALAREGFVVLIHDVFLWGSRRFPLETMLECMGERTAAMLQASQAANEVELYNQAAYFHEHWVSKFCNLLGTNLAGVVSFEDWVALNYLLSREDVQPGSIGCLGLSGGGNRAALLNATHVFCVSFSSTLKYTRTMRMRMARIRCHEDDRAFYLVSTSCSTIMLSP